ncbi:MAG: aminodeoxychorismate synthase component I, partial [Billgrantia desiderata]
MTARLEITPLPYGEDPLAYFQALRQRPGAVLLDSGKPAAPGGRYDIISSDPVSAFTVDGKGVIRIDGEVQQGRDPFMAQQTLLEGLALDVPSSDLPFLGGLIGYWGYDLGRSL